MPEGGQPYPDEIISNVLATGEPTPQAIMDALDVGGFAIVAKPPESEQPTPLPLPPEEGIEPEGAEMGPPPGAEGEMPPNSGPPGKNSALIIAVRGAMDEDKKRKSKAKSKKEAVA